MPFSEAVGFFCSVHSADRRPPLSQSMTGSSRLDLISGAVSGGDGFTCCNLPIYWMLDYCFPLPHPTELEQWCWVQGEASGQQTCKAPQ